LSSAVLVHESFDGWWPWAADWWHQRWAEQGPTIFYRSRAAARPCVTELLDPVERSLRRLACLGVRLELADLDRLPGITDLFATHLSDEARQACEARDIRIHRHHSEGFWGQSVAEYALALTLCGLRRIPQQHARIVRDESPWLVEPAPGQGRPGQRGVQFGDDARFTCGSLAGKRVRIAGMGNIGTRYAKWCNAIGADVVGWDPFASEPCFHLPMAGRRPRLSDLVRDAEVFTPMLPLQKSTEGLITGELIAALPKGCLVVLVTRSEVCDAQALIERVLAEELALAADVFPQEPLPLGHPLLGRSNVVHTPHNAGRTRESNHAWVQDVLDRFPPLTEASEPAGPANPQGPTEGL